MSPANDEMSKTYMNFRDANDSPTALLRAQSAACFAEADAADVEGDVVRSAQFRERAIGYNTAATFLMAQEIQTGVTFVALDNDTLNAIIDDYNTGSPIDVAHDAIDLLGLDG